jgi:hypothetical protein
MKNVLFKRINFLLKMSREVQSFEEALDEYKNLKEMFSNIRIYIYSVYKFVKDFPEFDKYFYNKEEAIEYIKGSSYMFILDEILDATGKRTLGMI